jgi:hypothetical protein
MSIPLNTFEHASTRRTPVTPLQFHRPTDAQLLDPTLNPPPSAHESLSSDSDETTVEHVRFMRESWPSFEFQDAWRDPRTYESSSSLIDPGLIPLGLNDSRSISLSPPEEQGTSDQEEPDPSPLDSFLTNDPAASEELRGSRKDRNRRPGTADTGYSSLVDPDVRSEQYPTRTVKETPRARRPGTSDTIRPSTNPPFSGLVQQPSQENFSSFHRGNPNRSSIQDFPSTSRNSLASGYWGDTFDISALRDSTSGGGVASTSRQNVTSMSSRRTSNTSAFRSPRPRSSGLWEDEQVRLAHFGSCCASNYSFSRDSSPFWQVLCLCRLVHGCLAQVRGRLGVRVASRRRDISNPGHRIPTCLTTLQRGTHML